MCLARTRLFRFRIWVVEAPEYRSIFLCLESVQVFLEQVLFRKEWHMGAIKD